MKPLRGLFPGLSIGGFAIALAMTVGGCGAEASAADPLQRDASPEQAAPRPGVVGRPAPVGSRAAGRGLLQGRIGAVAARWIERARRRTGGEVGPNNVRVSVLAVELEEGVELVALRPDEALPPASNMKLVTTAAAMALLGPGAELVTGVELGGDVRGGVLQGDLVVRAGGDPFVSADGSGAVEERLDPIARALERKGVARISGDLVLDEGTFPKPEPGPGWPDPSQHWAEYCARAAGLTLNGGVLAAEIVAGAPGGPARVELHPRPHGLGSKIGVSTSSGGSLDVRVGATTSRVTVTGRIPARVGSYAASFSHPDPVLLFGAVLRDRLERAGIAVGGATRRERGASGGELLTEIRSPLASMLAPINADSRNGVADQLFLALGERFFGRGDRAAGGRATARALEHLGVASTGLVQVDGSGLSRDNRVTARQIVALLAAVAAGPDRERELYMESLAVAGRSGTLAGRMQGSSAESRVHAKTGWIAGASALSGFARTLDGRLVVFSILVGYPREAAGLNTACWKPMQDEMAGVFVEAGAGLARVR